MNTSLAKAKLFIGSSSEALDAARALKRHLCDIADVEIWEDVFELGGTTLASLERQVSRSDYAVLITSPDDMVISRDTQTVAPRDNVVFEAGLFIGHLGKHRAFLVCDRRTELKLPSDWHGLTVAVYDSSTGSLSDALEPAAKQIIAAIKSGGAATEIDFLRSYLTFIDPNTRIWDSYAEILTCNYDQLKREIERLWADRDWGRLLEVKIRLREYFEYSGKYQDGARFGAAFAEALTALGKPEEAAWSRVKDIGYMMIMGDRHVEGRHVIKAVLENLLDSESIGNHRLLFYANRYIGISYQRDRATGDMAKAEEYFRRAQDQLVAFPKDSRDYKELDARICRNLGNVALVNGLVDDALKLYSDSLEIFKDLEDIEHIGYSHMALAKGLIDGKRQISDAPRHLGKALSSFTQLGCIEAHGRVHEQYGRYNLSMARHTRSQEKRAAFLAEAESHANSAKSHFQRIGLHRLSGRVDELLDQIQAVKSSNVA